MPTWFDTVPMEDACRYLHKTEAEIKELIRKGELFGEYAPPYSSERRWYITFASIEQYKRIHG